MGGGAERLRSRGGGGKQRPPARPVNYLHMFSHVFKFFTSKTFLTSKVNKYLYYIIYTRKQTWGKTKEHAQAVIYVNRQTKTKYTRTNTDKRTNKQTSRTTTSSKFFLCKPPSKTTATKSTFRKKQLERCR